MASRSVLVKFENSTSGNLHRTYMKLSGGIWSDNQTPPENISASSSGSWQSESEGFMTGTEGECRYQIPGVGEVDIKWDNPYIGGNSYSMTVPNGYKGSHEGGSSDNATVTFILTQDQ